MWLPSDQFSRRSVAADIQDLISRVSRALSDFMKHKKTPTSQLPYDIMLEVLSRCTSLDALASIRASCKSLNSLTYDSEFIAKLPIFSGFIQDDGMDKNDIFVEETTMELHSHPTVNMDFLPARVVRIEACSDNTGFVLCKTSTQHYICKPATKEWVQVPNPANVESICNYGLSVMSLRPFRFKLLRLTRAIYCPTSRRHYLCELYDSKTPDRWRTLKDMPLLLSESIYGHSITANGYIHFLASTNDVFAFDTLKDKWTAFPHPPRSERSLWQVLMKYKGKLCLLIIENFNDTQTLWMMDDYRNKVWTKKLPRIESFYSCDGSMDSDLKTRIMTWTRLWSTGDFGGPIYIQSDFQKSKWTLDAQRVRKAAENDESLKDMLIIARDTFFECLNFFLLISLICAAYILCDFFCCI